MGQCIVSHWPDVAWQPWLHRGECHEGAGASDLRFVCNETKEASCSAPLTRDSAGLYIDTRHPNAHTILELNKEIFSFMIYIRYWLKRGWESHLYFRKLTELPFPTRNVVSGLGQFCCISVALVELYLFSEELYCLLKSEKLAFSCSLLQKQEI